LTVERSIGGTSTLAKLRYEVARRWYLQALAGTESALDLFFTFTFD
jgi:autotransporter translocation and assembly factor TamB